MASKSAEINFKIVPEKLEDITASWCQHILHEGSTIDKGVVHQIVSPILNSESTNFLINIYYDFFFNWQTERKKNMFWTNKKFIFFLTDQTEKNSPKKLVKKIGETI